jgi:aspartate/methionine/tyrosine aminotransferase
MYHNNRQNYAQLYTIIDTIIDTNILNIHTNDAYIFDTYQYPIYSALSTLLNGGLEPYYLDEAKAWGLSAAQLEASLASARAKVCMCMCLCVCVYVKYVFYC